MAIVNIKITIATKGTNRNNSLQENIVMPQLHIETNNGLNEMEREPKFRSGDKVTINSCPVIYEVGAFYYSESLNTYVYVMKIFPLICVEKCLSKVTA